MEGQEEVATAHWSSVGAEGSTPVVKEVEAIAVVVIGKVDIMTRSTAVGMDYCISICESS